MIRGWTGQAHWWFTNTNDSLSLLLSTFLLAYSQFLSLFYLLSSTLLYSILLLYSTLLYSTLLYSILLYPPYYHHSYCNIVFHLSPNPSYPIPPLSSPPISTPPLLSPLIYTLHHTLQLVPTHTLQCSFVHKEREHLSVSKLLKKRLPVTWVLCTVRQVTYGE